MSTEKQMWVTLQPHLKREGLDPHRIENRVGIGTPDVNYLFGWIELKHSDGMQTTGTLALKHPPTPEQKVWLGRRSTLGMPAFLCLRVGRIWRLFDGDKVQKVWKDRYARPTEKDLDAHSIFKTNKPAELAKFLARYGSGK